MGLFLDLVGFGGSGAEFLMAVLTLILIDIVLAGDNAVVIALAVKSLTGKRRTIGLVLGAGLAVALRVILTCFAAQLLRINYVKLIGGVLILWIAVKLLVDDAPHDGKHREAANLWNAVWIILVADVSMSTDNVLALAGASKGNPFLLIFGLIVSIPLVVCTSSVLAALMDRYPIIVYAGAAILGKVGAELVMGDPIVHNFVAFSPLTEYVIMAMAAVSVLVVGKLLVQRRKGKAATQEIGDANRD